LSACNSGMGARSKGEGVISLARGFAYAGIPSQKNSETKFLDPFFWGGFVLTGTTGPIIELIDDTVDYTIWYVVFIMAILFLISLFFI
jgi:hypothetical protein